MELKNCVISVSCILYFSGVKRKVYCDAFLLCNYHNRITCIRKKKKWLGNISPKLHTLYFDSKSMTNKLGQYCLRIGNISNKKRILLNNGHKLKIFPIESQNSIHFIKLLEESIDYLVAFPTLCGLNRHIRTM